VIDSEQGRWRFKRRDDQGRSDNLALVEVANLMVVFGRATDPPGTATHNTGTEGNSIPGKKEDKGEDSPGGKQR